MGELSDLFDETPQANLALRFGIENNPDQAAEAARLARRYRLPIGVVKEFREDYSQKAKTDDAKIVVDKSPVLKSWIAKDQQNADISHDDVGNLSAVASAVRMAGSFGEGIIGQGGIGSAMTGLSKLNEIAGRGITNVLSAIGGDTVRSALETEIPWWLDPTKVFLERPGQALKGLGSAMAPDQKLFREDVVGGLGQFAGQAATALLTGGSATSLTMFAQGVDAMSEKVANDPTSQENKDSAALIGAGVTAVTEKYALDKILGPMAVPIKNAIAASLARVGIGAATEGAQEMAESIGQDVARMLLTDPDAKIDALATAYEVGVGATVGGIARSMVEAALHVKRRGDQLTVVAAEAEQTKESLQNLDALAKASKVRERDAVTFEQFVEHASEDGPVQDVFISGEALMQSGLLNQLAQVSPAIAEQAQTAAATGGDVRIPIAEYAARIAGTDLSASLLDHLKTSPNGLSQAEAKEYIKDQGDRLKTEVEAALGESDKSAQMMAGRDVVQAKVLEKLNATQRFTPDVNTLYAQQMASFFAIQAQRTGTTPEALFAQYEPRVVAESVDGPSLSQEIDAPAFKSWFGDSKVVDSDGKPLVVYHGTAVGFDEFRKGENRMSMRAEAGFWFSTSADDAGRYGNFTMPVYLSIRRPKRITERQLDFTAQERPMRETIAMWTRQGFDGLLIEPIKEDKALDQKAQPAQYVAFKPTQIKSATGNRGTFDPNDPNILNQDAQQPEQQAEQSTDLDGNPVIRSADVEIAYAQPTERLELIATEGQQLYNMAIMSPSNEYLGYVELLYENGKLTGLYDIEVEKDGRRDGVGVKVIEAILASDPQSRILISNVVPAARGFWAKVGVPEQNVQEGDAYDGYLDWNTYAASEAGKKRGAKALGGEGQSGAGKSGVQGGPSGQARQALGQGGLGDYASISRSSLADKGYSQSVAPQSVPDGRGFSPEQLSNIFVGEPLGPQGDRLVSVPSFSSMLSHVRRAVLDDPKILDAVIGAVSIDVVNNLFGSESAAKVALHNEPVFKDGLALNAELPVSSGFRDASSPVSLLMRETALIAAKVQVGPVQSGLKPAELNATVSAGDGDGLRQENSSNRPNATFYPNTNTIALLRGANLSSFLHESGHFYLEVLADLARTNPVIRRDMDAVLKWFGITDSETLRPVEKSYAAGEKYNGSIPEIKYLPVSAIRRQEMDFRPEVMEVSDEVAGSMDFSEPVDATAHRFSADETDTTPEVLLRDGHHRTAAALQTGRKWLPVTVRAINAKGEKLAALIAMSRKIEQELREGGSLPASDLPPAGRTPFETWELMTLDEKRPYHEKFARGFESYLFEGKSPSPEMGGMFARFRAWMVSVYKSIKALNVELTDEVRGVFDRMLATPEQIEAAQASREMGLMFASEEDARKFGVDWAAYQAKGQKATEQAVTELDKRSLADMQWLSNAKSRILKEMQKRNDGLRKEVERDVRSEVMARPVYRAWALLTAKEGEQVRGPDDAEAVAVGRAKLNTEELKERYGVASDADWRKLSALRMTSLDGVSPDSLSEQIGFTSGDEMVKALIDAVPPQEVVKAETDQRMLEQYGDITSEEALAKAVDEAVHNDMRQRVVADELAALEKAESVKEPAGVDNRGRQRSVRTLPKAAKEFAQNLIASIRIRDLRPAQYSTAAARAGVMAMRALKKNDITEAAKQKRNQLIQGYASKAASQAQEEVSDGLDYLRKVDKSQSIDQDYKDQIDTILERFDLKRGTSLKTIDKRKALSEWIAQQEEIGISPDLPADVTNEALRKSYKEMTVEEFRGLVDSVKQIEHLGRLKKKLLTAKDKRDFEAARDELVASIDANAKTKVDNRTRDTLLSGAIRLFKGYFASHRKTASLAKELDGFKDGGPMWEYLIRAMNEAGDTEAVMREKATIGLMKILKPVLSGPKLTGKGQFFSSVGLSLNRGERLVMALNTGNAGNLQRLLDGRGWTLRQIQPVLDTLTESDWQTVQAVWDFFEGYRPLIAAKERRVMGKEPDWVEPVPVVTKFGTLKGGYYPIKYDPRESGRAENFANAEQAKQELKGAFVASTTRRSFTKTRAEEVSGRPLLLTMDAIFSGANEVIHDLSWHEWVIDANRILRNDQIDKAIRDGYGADTAANLKQAVKDIAAGEATQADALSRVLSPLRAGASIAGLGLNLTNAMLQPLGLTQSMVRIGTRWVGLGIAEWAKSPVGLVKQVHAKSDFMRLRAKTQQRELNEIASVVKGKSAVRAKLDTLMFVPMTSMQLVADMPTWWGAYQKALANGDQEERAIEMADQAVIDAQGGGQVKDLSAIQRGGPLLKLFTTFYGYFNVAYNLGVERAKATNYRDPLDVMHLAWDFLLLYSAPAVLATLLKEALTGGGDDDEALAKKVIDEQISFLMGTMVGLREATGAMQYAAGTKQFDMSYGGPAGLRFVQELDKLGKQIGQGELDRALVRAGINVAGVVLHLPSGQVNKTIDGVIAISEGKTENPSAILFGPPKE